MLAAGLQAKHERESLHIKLSISLHYLSQMYEHYHFTQIFPPIQTHSSCMISVRRRTERSRENKRNPNKYLNMLAHLVAYRRCTSRNTCYPHEFPIKSDGDVSGCFRTKGSPWWKWATPLTPFCKGSYAAFVCGMYLPEAVY